METKLYIGAAGYDSIALPIVVTCCCINSISLKAPKLYKSLKTNFNSPFKKRMEVLSESIIDYKVGYIYPDELILYDKQTKVRQVILNITIQQYFKYPNSEIIIGHDLPSLGKNTSFPLTTTNKSSIERNLANYQAQTLREPYIIKAHQVAPQYEFKQNRGLAKYSHYFQILKHGISRYHHSISKQTFYNLYRDISLRSSQSYEKFYQFYEKTPYWWIRDYNQDFKDMFPERLKRRIEHKINYYNDLDKNINSYGSYVGGLLSLLPNDIPTDFEQWVINNTPKEEIIITNNDHYFQYFQYCYYNTENIKYFYAEENK